MSIDNIVQINISTQSLSMAQMGFGVPLILGEYGEVTTERVLSINDLSELPKKDGTVYEMAKAVLSQKPKISKLKIGKRKSNEDIKIAFNAILDEDSDFYGLLFASDDSTKFASDLSTLVSEVATKRMLLGVELDASNDKDLLIAADLKTKGYKNIFSIYKNKSEEYPAAAWMGKMLPQAPGSATWAFQELQGISKGQLSTQLAGKLKDNNVNRYINIKDVGVTLDGKTASGEYIDIICGIDWLHVRMQERLFRLLMVNPKIPYTLKGIDLVRSEIIAQLKEAVYQGVLASDPEPEVSIPMIDEIDPGTRGQRILPKIKFSGRLQGAIHEIRIEGTVGP